MKSVNSISLTVALLTGAQYLAADTPPGWINAANTSAYTATKGELEIAIAAQAVNDTLDLFNYREDLIAASGRLQGDSGDFNGTKIELNYGITSDLAIFYRRQQQSLTLELGEISSVNLVDIDSSLETSSETAGLKWTFFRSNLLNSDKRVSAASIEISTFSSESDEFNITIDEIRLDNLEVFFRDPQTFSVTNLEDDGWKARLIYSWPFEQIGIASVWAGYGESEATSGTTSDLTSATFKSLFEQSFDLEETYLYLGASLNTQITPRIPLSISYQFISLTDSNLKRFPEFPSAALPGFLSATTQGTEDSNHTLNARISYWLTPSLNLSLTANLYSNQFLGILPHYNNPLSGSFASIPYGFAGVELGYRF